MTCSANLSDEFRNTKAEFPNQFFDMIYRLYRLPRGSNKNSHPQFFGHFIRHGIFMNRWQAEPRCYFGDARRRRNPVVYVNGGRRYKTFQSYPDVVGLPAPRAHCGRVVGIGNSVKKPDSFERSFLNAFPPSKRAPIAAV